MNSRPDLGDDALRELLERRARRVGTEGQLAAIRTAAAATPQRRPARHLGFLQGVAAGAAGVAAIGVLAVVVALALGSKAPESPIGATASEAAPSSGPSAGPPATPVIPGAEEPVLPLTIDQVNAILLPNSNALLGRQLVIDATIVENPELTRRHLPSSSPPAFTGPPAILDGSIPTIGVEIAAAASLPGPLPWTGTFAARMIDTRTIEYLEPVTRAPGGEPLKPSQLSSLSALTRASGYVLVQGWIAGFDVPIPCPAPLVTPPPGPQYNGCAVTSSLSDTSSQPVSGTTFRVPHDGVQVQDRAYDDFAPDPQLINPGTQPELATFLLDQAFPTCPSGTYCSLFAASPHWQIVARLDPWPTPGQTVPPASGPSPSPTAVQPVQPLTVAQLNAFMAMSSLSPAQRPDLVITGTIQRNPSPSGQTCIPSGTTWSCPPAFLVGSSPKLTVEPVGDVGPGPWAQDGKALSGPFLATLDGLTLRYEGPVATTDGGEPLLPSQLPDPSKDGAGIGEWLVRGWISGVGIASPCPSSSIATANGFPEYACGGLTSFLIGDATQPVSVTSGGFSVKMPVGGIEVQDGGYDSFAPGPKMTGVQTEPEAGTFLVRALSVPDCGPNEDCAVAPTSYHWEIMARLDPWPVPALP